MNAARRGFVNVILKYACVDHGDGRKHEAHEDSSHRVEIDLMLSEKRIHNDYEKFSFEVGNSWEELTIQQGDKKA